MQATTMRLGLIFALTLPVTAGAATSADILKCQKAFESQVKSFNALTASKLQGCTEKVLACKLANEIDAVDATACLSAASDACSGVPAKLSDAETVRRDKIVTKCGLVPFGDLQQFVAGLGFFNVAGTCGAGDITALADCVLADGRCAIEHEVFLLDPRAEDSLTTAGVAGDFPCVGP